VSTGTVIKNEGSRTLLIVCCYLDSWPVNADFRQPKVAAPPDSVSVPPTSVLRARLLTQGCSRLPRTAPRVGFACGGGAMHATRRRASLQDCWPGSRLRTGVRRQ